MGLAIVLALVGAATAAPPGRADAAANCDALTTSTYFRSNPKDGVGLLTTWANEAANAGSRYGFSDSHGSPFFVSLSSGAGLTEVRRMSRAGDIAFAVGSDDAATLARAGYSDGGVVFYAATSPLPGCTERVQRFSRNGFHTVAAGSLTAAELTRDHWVSDDVSFYAAPTTFSPLSSFSAPALPTSYSVPALTGTGASNSDGVFTIAVLPDTQMEVGGGSDTRFADRNKWLVSNRKRLDLRFVTQVGDLVNWDTPDHAQYQRASSAMQVLEQAGVPWSPTVGNHDAQATCPGGAACPGRDVRVALRDTHTFDQYFPPDRFRAVRGAYQAGDVANTYSEFSAEGRQWLVLNLELWPRLAVVEWADWVARTHPHDNVIVVTHAYLDSSGQVPSNSDYGVTSPRNLWNDLISRNPNIKLVLSGHVGTAASRIDHRGKNPVVSYLQCFHDMRNNPTRLLTIDLRHGTVRGQVYYQKTNSYLKWADRTYSGLVWVK